MFKVVRAKKAEVLQAEKINKQPWKTNCSLNLTITNVAGRTGFVPPQPINLQTAPQDVIVRTLAELLIIRDRVLQAEELLGLEKTNKHEGFSYEDWIADCKKRVNIIGLQAKKAALAKLESRLDAIVSPEQRRAMELQAIAEELETEK